MGLEIADDNVDFIRSVSTNEDGELICDKEGCGKPVKRDEAVGRLGTYHKECYTKRG